DEKNQILTTNCWLTQIWTDHHLKWNASDFAGIRVIRVPYQRVWRPDTILYNNFRVSDFDVIECAYMYLIKCLWQAVNMSLVDVKRQTPSHSYTGALLIETTQLT
ncbi:hypothetical protein L9F63_000012, partial [Diploptera punctata]